MRKNFVLLMMVVMLAAACTSGGGGGASTASGEFSCSPTGSEPDQFSEPAQVITEGRDYVATITMANGGQVVIALYPDRAPITVNNFVFLACQGFYDGTTFHRVLPGFMAQGGDPTGSGSGGPGYTIAHEAGNGVPFDRAGLISMAHTGRPNSTGSQFFITYAPTPHLDADFTVFGQVIEGMDVVEGITPRDPENPADLAFTGDVIARIRVEEISAEGR